MILILGNNHLINNGLQHILNKLFIPAKIKIVEDLDSLEDLLPETQKIICDFENLKKIEPLIQDFKKINFLIVDNSKKVEYEYDFLSFNSTKEEIIEKLENFCNYNETNQDFKQISEREKEIIKLVASGLTNKEIADKLFISIHTVITHRKNISAKLGIKTISGLTTYAILNGLVEIDNLK